MYIPKYFEVNDKNTINAFIEENAFGQLISNSGGRPFSTHIPFLLSEDKSRLYGHLAKQNPQLQDIEGQEVLVTFQGAHDYVSPAWYENAGTSTVVPTWNYQAVHIYGQCTILSETEVLGELLDTLTNKYESSFSEPWQPSYKLSMLDAIVGIEIPIDEVQCKYKLSQNRSEQDRKQVIDQLKINGSNALAEVMEKMSD